MTANLQRKVSVKAFFLFSVMFFMCVAANARLIGAFDWAEHENADCIFIVKIKSWEPTNQKDGGVKISCDVVTTLKGKAGSVVEIFLSPDDAVSSASIFDSGEPLPGKYYLVFLRRVNEKLTPLDINFSFLVLPKYYALNSTLSPRDSMLFELVKCIESEDVETVVAGLDSCQRLALFPPSELLTNFIENKDSRIKGFALLLLFQQKNVRAIACLENMLCSKFENCGISKEMQYKLIDTLKMQPKLFSTRACNSLSSSIDARLQEAGVYMLMRNADISSIPVLLTVIDSENEQIQYYAYNTLTALTRANGVVILSFADFCSGKKDIVKKWKTWGEKNSKTFMEDPAHAKRNTKLDSDGIYLQN